MHEHELWFTKLLNQHLAGPVNALYNLAGYHTPDPAHPWSNYIAMEILVIGLIMAAALVIRLSLSVERPGIVQMVMENYYGFLDQQASDIVGHGYKPRLAFFCAVFISLNSPSHFRL